MQPSAAMLQQHPRLLQRQQSLLQQTEQHKLLFALLLALQHSCRARAAERRPISLCIHNAHS
jgi:hypothetical protein